MTELSLPQTFDRTFQTWQYDVSHSVLLFRSNKKPGIETRIDLMFRAVTMIKLRHRYTGIRISRASNEEIRRRLGVEADDVGDRIVFCIDSGERQADYIVAGSMFLAEDDLLYGEPTAIGNPELRSRVIQYGRYPAA